MVTLEQYFRELVDDKRRKTTDRLLLALLTVLSFPYAIIMRLRALAYGAGALRSHRLARPVVSVGNLTVGGTGKTPAVAFISRWFQSRGKRVAVLSRGYGGSSGGESRIVADGKNVLLSPEEAGDEPYLLASSIPGLMVVIGADRYGAGLLALEQLDPDIFILDDGFQHLRLARDLNLLLLDCAKPFGSGRTLPAGILREPKSAVDRADLVIYTRCDGREPVDRTDKPFYAASHRLTVAIPAAGGAPHSFAGFGRERVTAFAGIADPASFFDALEREGVLLVATLAFPDHTPYGEEEIAAICRLRDASRSASLITTGKDAVKLAPYLERLGVVYIAALEMEIRNCNSLEMELEKLLLKQR
ncbi:MAG: tetraacyldisaccharide [Geobacteraceae bacterium]|nr:MAG: tetraacyldisaccharide [Geobacteraceae bacterium]